MKVNTARASSKNGELMSKSTLRLAFIGDRYLDLDMRRAIVRKYIGLAQARYSEVVIVTIRDDPLGRTARGLAIARGLTRATEDRETNARNFLPDELTVACLMWAADSFVLSTPTKSAAKEYSYMAKEMCERMHKRYVNV